jgi:hypothetical protein
MNFAVKANNVSNMRDQMRLLVLLLKKQNNGSALVKNLKV